MIEAEQLQYKLNSFQEPLEDLSGSLALEAKKERIDQLELNMEEPGFWDNVEESQNVMKEVKSLKGVVEEYDDLKTKYEDIETLIDMAEEVEKRIEKFKKPIKVAVMGCAVNGPGEAREADFGIAGGKGTGLVFRKGKVLRSVPEAELIDALMEEIEKYEKEGE